MPRTRRSIIPGTPYHITQRGNHKIHVFHEDGDKRMFIGFAKQYFKEFKLKVYAWCIMSNHYHFIVSSECSENISKAFKLISQCYTLYYNRKHGLMGRLWQDRFFSKGMEASHFYEAVRYIELNPVRANIIDFPYNYPYSSLFTRFQEHQTIPLASCNDYFEVDDWNEYLMEKLEEGIVAEFVRNEVPY